MSATSWGAVSCTAALASVDLVTPYTAPARARVAATTASPALLTVELMRIPLVRSRAPDVTASPVRTWRGVCHGRDECQSTRFDEHVRLTGAGRGPGVLPTTATNRLCIFRNEPRSDRDPA